jgi:predicted dehydrogenase
MYLLGPFTSVSATASTQYPETSVLSKTTNEVIRTLPSEISDHYTFSGPLKSGAHATVVWRSTYPTTPGRTQLLWIIDGETGSIKFESADLGPLPTGLTNMFNPITTVNGQPLDEYLKTEAIQYSDPQLELNDGEKGGFIEFVRRSWIEYGKSLRGGQGEFATLDDAIEVQRVVDAIERSAERGGVAIALNK